MMVMDVRLCGPRPRWPELELVGKSEKMAQAAGGALSVSDDVVGAIQDCDFIYTDVWVSMGEPETAWQERISALRPYQVNRDLLELSHNPQVKFMHCLPAIHNAETEIGKKIKADYGLSALEVTDEVFESEQSIVFDQVENRMHTIKALLVATMGEWTCAS